MTHPAALDRFTPALERVLSRWPDGNAEEVLDAVAAGTAQLFDAAGGSVIVTRLIQEPGRLVCLVWLASGELQPLLDRYRDVEAWARGQGATVMRIQGRDGWARVLEGFGKVAVVLEKELQ